MLKRVQAGIQRVQSMKGSKRPRIRLPITSHIMRRLRQHWIGSQHPEGCLLWAVASLCFFGFFRSGELVVASESGFNSAVHLGWGDVAVNDPAAPTMLKIHLRRSKCDQFGKGVDVFVGQSGNELCPIDAIVAYSTVRGNAPGPFFCDKKGNALSKTRFIGEMRKALSAVGLQQDQYAGHSFRIGAATAAAQAGLEDSTIKALGRWNSSAFLLYIRTPRHQLASFTQALAKIP